MRSNEIFILTQPESKNSYWSDAIGAGIFDAAQKYGETVRHIDDCDISVGSISVGSGVPAGTPVLVIGNNGQWLAKNIASLVRTGARPVIVNACMLPIHRMNCSGVVFELEEMIASCVSYLRDAGRKKIVLLGANPDSVTDHVKCGAFPQPENIIFASGNIDDCVKDFVNRLDTLGYDAALCANDTVAVCLIRCMIERGYKLPERFFVIGMGNSCIGSQLRVPLTSVMFDYREMGYEAVRLLREIRRNQTECHIQVSLPCGIIVRESTRNIKPSASRVASDTDAEPSSYFAGAETQKIIRFEAFLQSCEKIDREILFSILRGESYERLAEHFNISERAVRYRISNIIQRYGCNSRDELCAELRAATGRVSDDSEGK